MTWSSSTRRATLPSDWPRTRKRILARDPVCRCTGCRRCTPTGCNRRSTDVDHTGHRDDHSSLRGLCGTCHAHRSSRQGAEAANTKRGSLNRPAEQHPGIRHAK